MTRDSRPVSRWGKPYKSMEIDKSFTSDRRGDVRVSRGNGLVERDMRPRQAA
jgi:hypothetical protein